MLLMMLMMFLMMGIQSIFEIKESNVSVAPTSPPSMLSSKELLSPSGQVKTSRALSGQNVSSLLTNAVGNVGAT